MPFSGARYFTCLGLSPFSAFCDFCIVTDWVFRPCAGQNCEWRCVSVSRAKAAANPECSSLVVCGADALDELFGDAVEFVKPTGLRIESAFGFSTASFQPQDFDLKKKTCELEMVADLRAMKSGISLSLLRRFRIQKNPIPAAMPNKQGGRIHLFIRTEVRSRKPAKVWEYSGQIIVVEARTKVRESQNIRRTMYWESICPCRYHRVP